MPYVIEIEIEKGEYTLVRKENPWTYSTDVWVFDSRDEAEKEAARWNTGRVLFYIRPMSDQERQRAKEKS